MNKADMKAYSLFGGAISTMMPEEWVDASSLRTVPNHQEVFLHRDLEVSLIIELLDGELTKFKGTDSQRILMHFEDLCNANESPKDQTSILDMKDILSCDILRGILSVYPRVTMIGKQSIIKFRGKPELDGSEANEIIIVLVLVRLVNVNSDMLVSLSLPLSLFISCGIKVSDLTIDNILVKSFPNINGIGSVLDSFRSFLNNLTIQDWNLFSN